MSSESCPREFGIKLTQGHHSSVKTNKPRIQRYTQLAILLTPELSQSTAMVSSSRKEATAVAPVRK